MQRAEAGDSFVLFPNQYSGHGDEDGRPTGLRLGCQRIFWSQLESPVNLTAMADSNDENCKITLRHLVHNSIATNSESSKPGELAL